VSGYGYGPSPTGRYDLLRDGEVVFSGTEGDCWRYLHRVHSCSVCHALEHEGYELRPAAAEKS
jgi:hypothetical protein